MDTTDAVKATAQWFRGNNMVQSASVGSQGISVIYTSGIWGGMVIDGERCDTDPEGMELVRRHQEELVTGQLKNTP